MVSADVARAADAASLWGDNFNLGPDQQVGAADAIAGSLTAALRSRFPKSIGSAPVLRPNQQTSNPEAYRAYREGGRSSTGGVGSRKASICFGRPFTWTRCTRGPGPA